MENLCDKKVNIKSQIKRRSSILKENVEGEKIVVRSEVCPSKRRVSFADTTSIKEFLVTRDANTEWNFTYEEPLPYESSASSIEMSNLNNQTTLSQNKTANTNNNMKENKKTLPVHEDEIGDEAQVISNFLSGLLGIDSVADSASEKSKTESEMEFTCGVNKLSYSENNVDCCQELQSNEKNLNLLSMNLTLKDEGQDLSLDSCSLNKSLFTYPDNLNESDAKLSNVSTCEALSSIIGSSCKASVQTSNGDDNVFYSDNDEMEVTKCVTKSNDLKSLSENALETSMELTKAVLIVAADPILTSSASLDDTLSKEFPQMPKCRPPPSPPISLHSVTVDNDIKPRTLNGLNLESEEADMEMTSAVPCMMKDMEMTSAVPCMMDMEMTSAIPCMMKDMEMTSAVPCMMKNMEMTSAVPCMMKNMEMTSAVPCMMKNMEMTSAVPCMMKDMEMTSAVPCMMDMEMTSAVPCMMDMEMTSAVPCMMDMEMTSAVPCMMKDMEMTSAVSCNVKDMHFEMNSKSPPMNLNKSVVCSHATGLDTSDLSTPSKVIYPHLETCDFFHSATLNDNFNNSLNDSANPGKIFGLLTSKITNKEKFVNLSLCCDNSSDSPDISLNIFDNKKSPEKTNDNSFLGDKNDEHMEIGSECDRIEKSYVENKIASESHTVIDKNNFDEQTNVNAMEFTCHVIPNSENIKNRDEHTEICSECDIIEKSYVGNKNASESRTVIDKNNFDTQTNVNDMEFTCHVNNLLSNSENIKNRENHTLASKEHIAVDTESFKDFEKSSKQRCDLKDKTFDQNSKFETRNEYISCSNSQKEIEENFDKIETTCNIEELQSGSDKIDLHVQSDGTEMEFTCPVTDVRSRSVTLSKENVGNSMSEKVMPKDIDTSFEDLDLQVKKNSISVDIGNNIEIQCLKSENRNTSSFEENAFSVDLQIEKTINEHIEYKLNSEISNLSKVQETESSVKVVKKGDKFVDQFSAKKAPQFGFSEQRGNLDENSEELSKIESERLESPNEEDFSEPQEDEIEECEAQTLSSCTEMMIRTDEGMDAENAVHTHKIDGTNVNKYEILNKCNEKEDIEKDSDTVMKENIEFGTRECDSNSFDNHASHSIYQNEFPSTGEGKVVKSDLNRLCMDNLKLDSSRCNVIEMDIVDGDKINKFSQNTIVDESIIAMEPCDINSLDTKDTEEECLDDINIDLVDDDDTSIIETQESNERQLEHIFNDINDSCHGNSSVVKNDSCSIIKDSILIKSNLTSSTFETNVSLVNNNVSKSPNGRKHKLVEENSVPEIEEKRSKLDNEEVSEFSKNGKSPKNRKSLKNHKTAIALEEDNCNGEKENGHCNLCNHHLKSRNISSFHLEKSNGNVFDFKLRKSPFKIILQLEFYESHKIIRGSEWKPKLDDIKKPEARLAVKTFEACINYHIQKLIGNNLCIVANILTDIAFTYDSMMSFLRDLNIVQGTFLSRCNEQGLNVIVSNAKAHLLISLKIEIKSEVSKGFCRPIILIEPEIKIGNLRKKTVEDAIAAVDVQHKLLNKIKAVEIIASNMVR